MFVTGSSKVPLGGFAQLQGMRGLQKFSKFCCEAATYKAISNLSIRYMNSSFVRCRYRQGGGDDSAASRAYLFQCAFQCMSREAKCAYCAATFVCKFSLPNSTFFLTLSIPPPLPLTSLVQQLDLPEYESQDVLKEKLLLAISETAGFGFA